MKLEKIDRAFLKGSIDREVAYMIATSHEYKTPNEDGAIKLVKNYKWQKKTMKIDKLQGIDKPVNKEKVFDIAKTIKVGNINPFMVVDKFQGITPQTKGHSILLDGHHRKEACEFKGIKEVPVYYGRYTGGAEKSIEELIEQKADEILSCFEKVAEKRYKMKELKKYQIPLTSDEKNIVRESKAVWNGGELAISKAFMPSGETVYFCYTHRACATAPTLKGAIGKFPFIKSTASEDSDNSLEKQASETFFYHASPVQGIKKFRLSEDTSGNNKGEVLFASKEPSFSAAFGLKWNDGTARFNVLTKDSKVPTESNYVGTVLKYTDDVDINKPCSMYKIKGDFKPLRYKNDIESITTNKDIHIVFEEQFNSFRDMAKEYGLKLQKVSEGHIMNQLKGKKSSNFEKKADENNNQFGNLAMGATGIGTIGASKNMILGKKTMYHGTSKENWDNIKNEGLRADRGGLNGASQAINYDQYIKNSTGKVHLTRMKPIANMYTNMADKNNPMVQQGELQGEKRKIFDKYSEINSEGNRVLHHSKMSPDDSKRFNELQEQIDKNPVKNSDILNMFRKQNKESGKRIKVNLDYDKFKQMEVDPDQAGPLHDNSAIRKLQKNVASRGNINVTPEEIAGSKATLAQRANHTLEALPRYIKSNKGRFGAGLALASGGAYMLNKGINDFKDKTAKEYYKEEIEKQAVFGGGKMYGKMLKESPVFQKITKIVKDNAFNTLFDAPFPRLAVTQRDLDIAKDGIRDGMQIVKPKASMIARDTKNKIKAISDKLQPTKNKFNGLSSKVFNTNMGEEEGVL